MKLEFKIKQVVLYKNMLYFSADFYRNSMIYCSIDFINKYVPFSRREHPSTTVDFSCVSVLTNRNKKLEDSICKPCLDYTSKRCGGESSVSSVYEIIGKSSVLTTSYLVSQKSVRENKLYGLELRLGLAAAVHKDHTQVGRI